MDLVRIQQDAAIDPSGAGLGRFLAAHLHLERAVRRRVVRAQVTALLGVPLWLAALLSVRASFFYLAASAFAVSALALVLAIADELVCRRNVRVLSRSVRATRVDDRPSPPGA